MESTDPEPDPVPWALNCIVGRVRGDPQEAFATTPRPGPTMFRPPMRPTSRRSRATSTALALSRAAGRSTTTNRHRPSRLSSPPSSGAQVDPTTEFRRESARASTSRVWKTSWSDGARPHAAVTPSPPSRRPRSTASLASARPTPPSSCAFAACRILQLLRPPMGRFAPSSTNAWRAGSGTRPPSTCFPETGASKAYEKYVDHLCAWAKPPEVSVDRNEEIIFMATEKESSRNRRHGWSNHLVSDRDRTATASGWSFGTSTKWT